jgi:hypothetical protein
VAWLKRGRDKVEDTDGLDPFGRSDEAGDAAESSEQDDDSRAPGTVEASTASASSDRTNGPFDVSEVEASDAYVDLGGLWLPGREGMELRLEVEEETGRVIAATIQLGGSAVQLQAFAAPRTQGIWDEIRKEIASSVTRQGGTADEMPGVFGRELLARVPARGPDGRTTHQPARFAGIDGPRWFLRAVFHGEAAYEAEQATELETLVRGVVVVRGGEAMAPRELLTLRLPDGVGAVEPEVEEPTDARDELRPFERGPEITEVR